MEGEIDTQDTLGLQTTLNQVTNGHWVTLVLAQRYRFLGNSYFWRAACRSAGFPARVDRDVAWAEAVAISVILRDVASLMRIFVCSAFSSDGERSVQF